MAASLVLIEPSLTVGLLARNLEPSLTVGPVSPTPFCLLLTAYVLSRGN